MYDGSNRLKGYEYSIKSSYLVQLNAMFIRPKKIKKIKVSKLRNN